MFVIIGWQRRRVNNKFDSVRRQMTPCSRFRGFRLPTASRKKEKEEKKNRNANVLHSAPALPIVRAVTERETFRANVPRWYRGEAHLAFTLLSSLGVAVGMLLQLHALRRAELWAVPLFFLFCCFVEYVEHRHLLHRNSRLSAFAFRIHTLEHHRFFTDEAFTPESRRDWAFVLFPLRLVAGYLVGVVGLFTLLGRLISPNVGWLVGATTAGFFFLYEVIHFAGHFGLAGWLGEHHRVHHRVERMTGYNFNVVFPLFDWLFGTRSRS